MIRAIAFDVGNVLLDLHYDRMVASLARVGGVDANPLGEQMDALLKDYDDHASLYAEFERGLMDSDEFIRRFCEQTGIKTERQEFEDAWNDLFSENKGTAGLVAGLEGKLPLLLLSNTNPLHAERFLVDFPVFARIKERVFSYEVGVMKPQPEIYEAALDKAGCEPNELFFIEDRQMNIEGAQKLGMEVEGGESVKGFSVMGCH